MENKFKVGAEDPDKILFDKYLIEPSDYNFDFTTWEVNPDHDVEISFDKIIIKKFKPNMWIVRDSESLNSTNLSTKFKNLYLLIEGIQQYSSNIFSYRFYSNGAVGGDGGTKGSILGVGILPYSLHNTPTVYYAPELPFSSYVWDVATKTDSSTVQVGSETTAWRGDWGAGYNGYGFRNNYNTIGGRLVYPDIKTFPTPYNNYKLAIGLYTGNCHTFDRWWSDTNLSSYLIKETPFKVTISKRGSTSKHLATQEVFSGVKFKFTGMSSGDSIKWSHTTSSIVDSSGTTITEIVSDGIYTISNTGVDGGFVLSNTDTSITNPITVEILDQPYMDENGIIDISDSPIIITLINQNGIDGSTVECWDAFLGDEQIYHKDKTVANCLMEYCQFVNDGGILKLPENASIDGQTIKLPNLLDIVDINDYNPKTLKIQTQTTNNNPYVDYLNNYYEGLSESNTEDSLYTLINDGNYGPLKVNNDTSNPLVMYIPLGGSDNMDEAHDYQILDFVLFDNALGGAQIGCLHIIFKDRGLNHKQRVSTTLRSFQNTKFDSLEIYHEEADGTRVTPFECDWGFAPVQLRAAFEGSNISIIKRDWMSWERVSMMPYCFDMCQNLTEVQSNGEECNFYPHNMTSGPNGNEEGYLKWPFFKNSSGNAANEDYDAGYAFWRCSKLTRFEPIINVKYWANPNMYKYMFKDANNIEYIKIKGLNNMDWDFTSEDLYLPNLNQECVQYLFDNLEDQVSTPYNEANIDTTNSSPNYLGVYYDTINIRTSRSVAGLNIKCPIEWENKITNDMISAANAKGWNVYIGGELKNI